MLTDQQFNNSYLAIYEQEYKKALSYSEHPKLLQDEIERELKLKDPKIIYPPYPDLFSYRMTRYRGFIKYPNRLKNFVIAENEPPSDRRSFLPHIIDLEPNAHCNYRCIMCHVSEWKNGKRTNNLKLEPFKQFIDDNPQLTEVKLHGMGEPLLHPDYFEMIRYLVEKNIWVRTSTNASVLHVKENIKRLIDSGIGEVQVSFDGATKEVYEKIRRRGKFDRVLENCTLLNKYANLQDRLYTRMWVVVQKYNRHQLPEFVRIAGKMGFRRLSLSFFLNEWGLDTWKEKNHKLQTDYSLSTQEEQNLLDTAQDEGVELTLWRQSGKYHHSKPKLLCPWVFARPYISCDLYAVPCSMIGNPDVSELGEAKNLRKTWNSEKYINFRRSHLLGNIPEICKLCYA
jgi:MoaA/NifB/PqqE/SkfB family radical SAM enzyme